PPPAGGRPGAPGEGAPPARPPRRNEADGPVTPSGSGSSPATAEGRPCRPPCSNVPLPAAQNAARLPCRDCLSAHQTRKRPALVLRRDRACERIRYARRPRPSAARALRDQKKLALARARVQEAEQVTSSNKERRLLDRARKPLGRILRHRPGQTS